MPKRTRRNVFRTFCVPWSGGETNIRPCSLSMHFFPYLITREGTFFRVVTMIDQV